jgi:hypothetical protein
MIYFRRTAKSLIKWRKKPGIYIISYPKTGRTWLRALIGRSLCEMNHLAEEKALETEYVTIASGLPRTAFTHDGSGMQRPKNYRELSSDKSQYRNRKVLLLSRDVKDTLVSAYFQATRRINVFDGSISEFIRSERYGARKILTFYKHWYENRDIPRDFLFIRYEEMHRSPEYILAQTLRFLGVNEIDERVLQVAVRFASFNNLRRLESANRFKMSILTPKDPNDPESFKVRKGKIGGYTEYLTDNDIEYIDGWISELGTEFTVRE